MRFSSIQQIDPIIAATYMRGMMGGKIIIDGFRSQFPKLLDPNKPKEIQGFTVVRSLGVANRGGERTQLFHWRLSFMQPTEWQAWYIYHSRYFLIYLLLLKKLCWDIRGRSLTYDFARRHPADRCRHTPPERGLFWGG